MFEVRLTEETALMMDQNLGQHNSSKSKAESNDEEMSKKCTLCNFASMYASNLRIQLMMHNGEKPIKCNQCDFASTRVGNMRTHMGQFLQDGKNVHSLSLFFKK